MIERRATRFAQHASPVDQPLWAPRSCPRRGGAILAGTRTPIDAVA